MTEKSDAQGERLQKILAQAGFGSRRACEELITSGRVKVNGEVPILGARVSEKDEVTVDKTPVVYRMEKVYYLLNKPVGVVSTASDPQKRKTVLSLVPKTPRVFSVGRLDLNTEGLLILTNDGSFSQYLQHPSFGINKEYFVELDKAPTNQAITKLRNGIELDDGKTSPAKVSRIGATGLRVTIHEGRNRQVRRMCEAVGYRVKRLVRTKIGSIADRNIKPGKWRNLKENEVQELVREATKAAPRRKAVKRSARSS